MAERAEQIGAATTGLRQTLAEFGRVEAGLREQRTAIAAALAEFPVEVEQAKAARVELDEQVARLVTEAQTRLGDTTTALMNRLAAVETAIGALTEQLQRAAEIAAEVKPAPVAEAAVAVEPVVVVEEVIQPPEPAAEALVVLAVEEAPKAAVKEKPVVRMETIMDPFLIPDDGYAALAEAMDRDRV